MLNYLDHPITQPYFGLFIGVWIYMRHYINLRILWAVLTEFKTVGPYELNWETQQYKCWISQIITFGLLAMLQSVNIFWLFLILRIAFRFFTTNVGQDDRSEDEDEEVENEERDQILEKRDRAEQQDTPDLLVNGAPLVDETINVDRAPQKEMATRRSPRRKG